MGFFTFTFLSCARNRDPGVRKPVLDIHGEFVLKGQYVPKGVILVDNMKYHSTLPVTTSVNLWFAMDDFPDEPV